MSEHEPNDSSASEREDTHDAEALSLAERELVALVDGRRDLTTALLRAHVEEDDGLDHALSLLREERDALSLALRRAEPELGGLDGDDVSELVALAMSKAEEPDIVRISPRSFGWGAVTGGVAVLLSACAWIAFQETMTAPISAASENVRFAWSLGASLDRVVALLPGAWTSIAAVALSLGAVLLVCLRWLEHGKRIALPAAAAIVLFTLLGPGMLGRAHAYEIEGAWPSPDPRVDVDVEAQPLPVALEAATRSVNLGLVYGVSDTRLVTLHAHGVPLREVLEAMLGTTPAVVRHTGHMVVVSSPQARHGAAPSTVTNAPMVSAPVAHAPVASAPVAGVPGSSVPVASVPVAGAATVPIVVSPSPVAPASPLVVGAPQPLGHALPLSVPPSPHGRIEDVLTFGGDANVPNGRDVRDVVTMGGDARVDGRAFGNVVTMGGDADIGGIVVGNVATMGGDIRIRPTGVVFGRLETMGGEVVHEPGGSAVALSGAYSGGWHDAAETPGDGVFAAVVDVAEAGLRYALLFLGALLFAFFAPERFARLHTAVRRAPLRSVAGGTVALLAAGMLSLVLVITIIGIPVAFLLGLAVFVAACAGLATVGHLVGQALPIRVLEERPVLRLAAGIAALFVVTRVPFFGWFAFLIALCIGLGAVVLTRLGKVDVDVDP